MILSRITWAQKDKHQMFVAAKKLISQKKRPMVTGGRYMNRDRGYREIRKNKTDEELYIVFCTIAHTVPNCHKQFIKEK